jgi:hypothetical protein
MKKIIQTLYSILPLIFIGIINQSCTEIFEGDLEDQKLIVITPKDSLHTNLNQVVFAWEKLDDATGYHLRIVRPDFKTTTELVLDSTVSQNSYKINLLPGKYAWRLKAVNAITETDYIEGQIHIDSTLDVTQISPDLISPANNIYINQSEIIFSWQEIYNASYYRFSLIKDGSLYLKKDSSDITSIKLGNLEEGSYLWSIQVFNDFTGTQSQISTHNFWIDKTTPIHPFDRTPLDSSQENLSIGGDSLLTFSWKGEFDNSVETAAIEDVLEVSTSSTFSNKESFSIFPTGENRTKEYKVNSSSTVYWRIKSQDSAGNQSTYTPVFRIGITF